MQVLTRDDTQHGEDYVRLRDALQEIADLRNQLADEQRQHDITRGDLVRTRLVRDEALQQVAAMKPALQEADLLMDHCDEPTEWREKWGWMLNAGGDRP
jgi:hypothetical protein